MTRLLILPLIAICVLGLPLQAAWSQDAAASPREEALMKRVEELEKRLADLEARLTAPPPTPAPAEAPAVAAAEPAKEAEKAPDPNALSATFRDGFRLESEDKKFRLKIGVRLMSDWAWINQDEDLKVAVGDIQDGAFFRYARVDLSGAIYDNIEFRTEYEFAGNDGQAKFRDVYMGMTGLPGVGNLRIGHFREPMGLERCTGISDHTFMELALPTIFAPNRNLGLMFYDAPVEERMTWAVGAFKEVDDFPSINDADEDQGWAVTGRVTGLPWYRDKGRKLLHLGAAYSLRNPDGATINWSTRPETQVTGRLLDTELLKGFRLVDARMDNVDLMGLEGALILGPFLLQSEYMAAYVDTTFGGERDFDGWYVQSSYFLTGENRPYKTANGWFGPIKPKKNFSLGPDSGWGAWEVAARYSTLDLNDDIIRGGEGANFTLGLNWYLNPNARLMINYGHAMVDHDLYEGDLDIFQTRFQLNF